MAIETGDTVQVHYTGREKNGRVFDSSEGRDPLEFTVGAGEMIPGFDAAVLGKNPGDKFTVAVTPEQGYGDVDNELIFTVPRQQFPPDIPLAVGTPLSLSTAKNSMDVTIADVGAEEVTLDANHPLAGKHMEFDIEILNVKKGSKR